MEDLGRNQEIDTVRQVLLVPGGAEGNHKRIRKYLLQESSALAEKSCWLPGASSALQSVTATVPRSSQWGSASREDPDRPPAITFRLGTSTIAIGRSPHLPGRVSDRAISMMSSRRGRIFLAPGNPKPDLEVNAAHRPELEVAVRQILRPFRRKADAEARRDKRHQREGIIAAVSDVAGQTMEEAE